MSESIATKKKVKKHMSVAHVYVNADFNNTIITATDPAGNAVCFSSSGKLGFRGAKKSTPYVAQLVAEDVAKVLLDVGVKTIVITLKGPGLGRDASVRQLNSMGLIISAVRDVTPIVHNGCRSRKKRYV